MLTVIVCYRWERDGKFKKVVVLIVDISAGSGADGKVKDFFGRGYGFGVVEMEVC